MRKLTFTALFGALMLMAAPAMAQGGYPERPITLMIAFPAGGSTDTGARIVAGIAEKILGQSIIVVNKGGAGGQVGWTEMSRQKPDGYYIGYINLPALNTVIADEKRQAIFDQKDFTPIINQVLDPGVIWVAANSPYKSAKEIFAAAKAKPGTLRAATTGILSDDHLAILMTEEAIPGVNFRLVHLVGGAAQMKETLAGNIDVSFDNVGSIVKQVKGGQVRALAVMDSQRSKFLPDVPTMKELGYPKVISSSTRGIAGPAGMDPKIVKKLQDAFKKAMADPEHVKKMEDVGLALKVMVGEEYQTYYDNIHKQAIKYTEWAAKRPQK